MIDAKAYLQQIKLCDTHINNKLEEKARLKMLALNISSTIKGDAPGGARKLMEDAPAVDAAPVVHSRWRLNKDGSGTCQHCKRTTNDVWDRDNWDHYCSHCGAKMDGEKE